MNSIDDYTECKLGGDTTDDCNGCAYSGDYHFVDGECVEREEDGYIIDEEGNRFHTYRDMAIHATEQRSLRLYKDL